MEDRPKTPSEYPEERSTTELLTDIVGNIQEIVRFEAQLMKAEVREEAGKAGRAATLLAGGAIFALFGAFFVFFCLMFVAALFLPAWLSALLVGMALFLAAAVLISIGRERWKNLHGKPERTIDSLKENLQWARNQTR